MAAYVAAPIGVRSTVVVGSRADGDFRPDVVTPERRSALLAGTWTMLTEEHGAISRIVRSPGDHDGADGDALYTTARGAVLGVWVGDCAPIAVIGDRGVGIAHAGWRGLREGILDSLLDVFDGRDDRPRSAVIGPHIRVCCNEFGASDLTSMVDRFGAAAAGSDTRGRPALDVAAVARRILAHRRIDRVVEIGSCTRCRPDLFFSHRGGHEARQTMAISIDG